MNEDKASRYHRLIRRAEIAGRLGSALLLAALVLSPLSRALHAGAAGVAARIGAPAALEPAVVVALYVLMLALVHEALSLPLAYYRGHLLESRYGLSAQTGGSWLRTHVKACLVALVVVQIAVAALYTAIRLWPVWWWVAAAAGVAALRLWLACVGPVLLLPLFYTLTPLSHDGLRRRLVTLAGRAGTTVLGVFGWTLSDSTRKANAALVGMGRTRRILLSDTLLADYSDDEVEVVLAHELAHHVHGDLWRGQAFDALTGLGSAWLAHRVLAAVGPSLGLTGPADVAGLPLILLAAGAVSVVVAPIANAQSRAHERRADRFALDLTGHSGAFTSAMRRLAQQNLAEERPSWWARAFFYSHPPIAERLQLVAGGRPPGTVLPSGLSAVGKEGS